MKKLFILLFILVASIHAQNIGTTTTPRDTSGWDEPAGYTPHYGFYIFELLSHPGGRINLNTDKSDSLFYALIVYTDSTQMIIRNDTLLFSPTFIQSILDTAGINIPENYLDFVLGTLASWKEGRVTYDTANHALVYYNEESDVAVQLGQEFLIPVYNMSDSTIANGDAVCPANGASKDRTVGLVRRAKADHDSTSNVIGCATHDILPGSFGYVTNRGFVRNLNTSSASSENVNIYLSATDAGSWTETPPDAPNNIVRVGGLVKKHATEGTIYVYPEIFNPDNGIASIAFTDESTLIDLTQNVEARITNVTNDLFIFNSDIGHDVSLSGDTVYVAENGVYEVSFSMSFQGGTAGIYKFYMKENSTVVPNIAARRYTSTSDVGTVSFSAFIKLSANDPLTFWVVNTATNTDITFIDCSIIINQER